MIDYVTLLLVNMVGALVVLAAFLVWGFDRPEQKTWAPAFGIAGLVATVCGLAMTFTWPIPKPYATAYGEMSVLLGVLFLGASWALAAGYDLWPLGLYAFLPGAVAIEIGIRIIHLSLTAAPTLAGIGFILTGLGGVGASVTLWRQQGRTLRLVGAAVLLAAAAIWILTAIMAYWIHMKPPESQQSAAIHLRADKRVEVAERRSTSSRDSSLALGLIVNRQ
jgi:putative membrane protein